MTIKETLSPLHCIVDNIYSDTILNTPVKAEIKEPGSKDVYKYDVYEMVNDYDYIHIHLCGSGGKPPMVLREFIMQLANIEEENELITLDGLYRICFIDNVEFRTNEVVLLGSLEEEV